MRSSPSIVPPGTEQDIYLVLDDYGHRLGRAWVETNEEHTDLQTLLRHLLEGQFHNPARVVCFNTDERWSRDASEEIADELQQRCAERGEIPDHLQEFLERHDTGQPIQLPLPIAI